MAAAGSRPAWHLYVVRHERADELGAALRERGIDARSYYRVPLHRQTPLASEGSLPHTDAAAATNLAIPIGPSLTPAQIDGVVAAVRDALT